MKILASTLFATALALFLVQAPAQAQSIQGPASGDLMALVTPVVGMMKKKIGKRRFTQMIRMIGPMAAGMMSGGGAPGFDMIGTGVPGGAIETGYAPGMMYGGGYGISGLPGLDQVMSGGMIQSLIGMGMPGRSHRGHRRHRAAT